MGFLSSLFGASTGGYTVYYNHDQNLNEIRRIHQFGKFDIAMAYAYHESDGEPDDNRVMNLFDNISKKGLVTMFYNDFYGEPIANTDPSYVPPSHYEQYED